MKHNNYFSIKSFLANSTGEIEQRAHFDNAYFLLVFAVLDISEMFTSN